MSTDDGGISSPPARSLVTGHYQYSNTSSCRVLVAEAVRTSRANIYAPGNGTDRSLPMPPRPLPHIPINEEEAHHVDVVHGEDSWEAKVLHFLHSKTVQYTLMGLLLLDVVILFVELFLGAQYPACTFIVRDAISCCPSTVGNVTEDGRRILGEASATCEAGIAEARGHHAMCEAGVDTPQCQAGCDSHKYDGVHMAHTALFFTTITILTIFMIELILLIVCLKPRVFFRKSFYVLDLLVVSVSLSLESLFYAADDETLQSLIGVIVLARCWRFVRIGHGLVEVTHEYASRKHDKLVAYCNECEKLLRENGIGLPLKKKKIDKLKRLDSPLDPQSSSESLEE
eukprot:CAMPEP_0197715138 /NCGR_PEP_ID=MMETSP1434-20131217/361_1 /TAXON_ID=265543 /ORGANISM="Minutocellus polymorphus, Strain CCMP3303" /LENGTH=341 /DNA_ID=CAMNT_0043299161 /DNA_START=63 /DNA_END=1088 /DNA_ORIENTATION=+